MTEPYCEHGGLEHGWHVKAQVSPSTRPFKTGVSQGEVGIIGIHRLRHGHSQGHIDTHQKPADIGVRAQETLKTKKTASAPGFLGVPNPGTWVEPKRYGWPDRAYE